ncbi:poly-beta-1,6-N-acetyl-D-glucosamine biosynthesis protein PgaD [Solilutibacter pythonis]|nr:poly-beta-1,6-N-acetyl-D-glucosamine biosynthesis protein PgaD [Lysobacter pythonis]
MNDARPAPPIICCSQLVPLINRRLWAAVTATFWIAYLHLWLPLLTLLLWLLGLRKSYGELYLREHSIEPFVLTTLPILALLAMASLLGWAEYNRLRFSGQDRRTSMDDVPLARVADQLGASPELARQLQRGKAIVLRMDSKAMPVAACDVQLPAYTEGRPGFA